MDRRTVLRATVADGAAAFSGSLWAGAAVAAPAQPGPSPYGPPGAADANGIQLPAGFTSRVIARSRKAVAGTSYAWHDAPDGGVCFAAGTGWIYVSNSEITPGGGASAVRFNADGSIASAYRILSGTNQNCAGGATPWGTWLSCEEVSRGYVYETYPQGGTTAVRQAAMGRFKHEAAACDPDRRVIYLTEDETNGCFYRFRPTTWGNLSAGTLEVLVAGTATSGPVTWARVPDQPGRARSPATRSPGPSASTAVRAAGTPTAPAGSPPRATTGSGRTTRSTSASTWRTTPRGCPGPRR